MGVIITNWNFFLETDDNNLLFPNKLRVIFTCSWFLIYQVTYCFTYRECTIYILLLIIIGKLLYYIILYLKYSYTAEIKFFFQTFKYYKFSYFTYSLTQIKLVYITVFSLMKRISNNIIVLSFYAKIISSYMK